MLSRERGKTAMATGDIYEVIDVQSYEGQEVLNVYHYFQAGPIVPLGGETIAQLLAEDWEAKFVPLQLELQVDTLVHETVTCRNLFDDTDQGEAVSGTPGAQTAGEGITSFMAYGLTLNHDNASIRPGGKRIAGPSENNQAEGVVYGAAVTVLQTFADELAEPLPAGIIIPVDTMFPVVVKRVREGLPGEYTYRLPISQGELIYGTILEVLVKALLTSQVSRKVGVGV